MINQNQAIQDQTTIKIKQFINESFLYDRPELLLTNDIPLIEQGIIDSMGIFRLITFLEEAFGFTVEPTEIVIENFESVAAIATMVSRKAGA